MNYTQIAVQVNDQTLTLSSVPKLASGGVDEVKITAEFDALWNGFEKTAVFYRQMGEVYHVAMDDDSAVVPWEVMKTKGTFCFGIMGENENGAVRTTEVLSLDVVQGAVIEREAGYEPTPDVYTEILNAVKRAEEAAGKCLFEASEYYTKSEIDAVMESYITDIDALIGGEA